MTNINNNLYELPKTATISYYDVESDQNLTTEEYQQLYPHSEEITIIDKTGGNFRSEKALHGVYGPGFWDDIKGFVKPAVAVTLTVASIFPPTAVVAAPIAIGIAGTGLTVAGIGEITDDKDFKEFGRDLIEMGSGAMDGQGCFNNPDCPLHEYAVARNRR